MSAEAPRLTVVVVEVSDTVGRPDIGHLAGCLDALTRQLDAPPTEILVPYVPRGGDDAGSLSGRFSEVSFIAVPDLRSPVGGGSREHHDELRARGLARARGELVGLLEDHARPDARWSARASAVLGEDHAAMGGAIENDIDRALNWAVYFCDFHPYMNPVPAGDTGRVSDANVVYKRAALEAIRPVWEASFNEPAVNAALAARGERLALDPELVVHQHRTGLSLAEALEERFVWGRSYAAGRAGSLGGGRRLILAVLSPFLPALLLLRMTRTVLAKGRGIGPFVRALPLTALLLLGWSFGEATGYLTGRAGAAADSRATTGRTG